MITYLQPPQFNEIMGNTELHILTETVEHTITHKRLHVYLKLRLIVISENRHRQI